MTPPWQRSPWWYGLANRDWLLLGFILTCTVVALVFFLLIVLMHEAQ